MGGIHRFLRGVETWPRLKAQQNSRNPSLVEEAEFERLFPGWKLIHRVMSWNLLKYKTTNKRLAEKARNDTTLLYKTNTNC